MVLLLSKNEADCLVPQHKQNRYLIHSPTLSGAPIPRERFSPLADGCLWALVPQSSPSPKCAVYPSSALREHWEPRLSATFGHSCFKKLASGMTGLKAQQTLLVVATAMKNSTKQALEVR